MSEFALVNSGEWVVTEPVRPWREENGIIYFTITSDGTTGPEWEKWFVENGYDLWSEVSFILKSPAFIPTPTGTTTTIAVLKGALFEDRDRITKKIRVEADTKKFIKLNIEAACLIRRNFSDDEIKAMGLWGIVIMHEPTNDSDGDPDLLVINRYVSRRGLVTFCGRPDEWWRREDGFAFAVLPVVRKT
jgi:hypothetical protein